MMKGSDDSTTISNNDDKTIDHGVSQHASEARQLAGWWMGQIIIMTKGSNNTTTTTDNNNNNNNNDDKTMAWVNSQV